MVQHDVNALGISRIFFTKLGSKFSLLCLLFILWVKETLGKTTALSEEGGGGGGPFKFNAGSVLIGKLSTTHFDFVRVRGENVGSMAFMWKRNKSYQVRSVSLSLSLLSFSDLLAYNRKRQ